MTAERHPVRDQLGLIVAVGPGGLIGRGGGLPWRIPEDMAHFKATTAGHCLVMGRRTFTSIGRPLPGRRLVVVTRDRAWQPPTHVPATVAHSLEEGIAAARETDPCPMVAGGAAVYEAALPLVTDLWWTTIGEPACGPEASEHRPGDIVMCAVDWDGFEVVDETDLTDGAVARHLRRSVTVT